MIRIERRLLQEAPKAHLLFCLRFYPGNNVRRVFAGVARKLRFRFAGRIQQDNGRIPFFADPILAGEPLILLHDFRSLFFSLRKINLDQNEVFLGISKELGLGKNHVVKFDAGAAPVGAGKIHQKVLVLGLRLLKSLGEIDLPVRSRGNNGGREKSQEADDQIAIRHGEMIPVEAAAHKLLRAYSVPTLSAEGDVGSSGWTPDCPPASVFWLLFCAMTSKSRASASPSLSGDSLFQNAFEHAAIGMAL